MWPKVTLREKWINNLINIPDRGRMFVGKKGVQHVSLTFVRKCDIDVTLWFTESCCCVRCCVREKNEKME